jgi:hypothetical protein
MDTNLRGKINQFFWGYLPLGEPRFPHNPISTSVSNLG